MSSCRRPHCCWTTRRCCSSTPAWSRSSRTSWARPPRRTPARPRCRRWSGPWTSTRSARRPGTHRSSRWPATSRSGTTSRNWRSRTPGNCSPTPWPTAGTVSIRSGCGPRSTWTTTRPSTSGTTPSGSRWNGSSGAGRPTTSGRWAFPDPVARVPRSTTTGGRSSAGRAARSSTRTATSRCGTWSSCRTSEVPDPPRRGTRSWVTCRPRTSTPVWVWSAWRPCSRASTTSTRSTPRRPSSRSRRI